MSDEVTKVALITGACGGIGKALVYKYVSQGVSLAIADKSLKEVELLVDCLLYTSPSPRDLSTSRMPSSA